MRYMEDGIVYDTDRMKCVYTYTDDKDHIVSYYRFDTKSGVTYAQIISEPAPQGSIFCSIMLMKPELFRQKLEDRFNDFAGEGAAHTTQSSILDVYQKEFGPVVYAGIWEN